MADKIALQESAQALFCSIADSLGSTKVDSVLNLKQYPSYGDFKSKNKKLITESFKKVSSPGVGLNDIDNFLSKNNDWYVSSTLIANKLIKQITNIDEDFKINVSGHQNIFYFRGDEEVMGTIQKLFSIANKSPITIKKQASFGNINKWNPADIYFASKKASAALLADLKDAKPGSYNFTHLNVLTASLIDSGDLLPLSLKKTTSDVEIEKINFSRQDVLDYLSGIKFKGITNWKPYKKVPFPQKGETRDIRIFLHNNVEVKMRHDPSAKRFVTEIIGGDAEARGGSIGSMNILCELLGFVDPVTSRKILEAYTKGEEKYFKEMKPIDKKRDTLEKKDKNLYTYTRGEVSAINIINSVMPIIKQWFSRKDKKSIDEINDFMRILFEYVTSRTERSGRFVIAK